MKSCCDLSRCTDHPQFSKKVIKNLLISTRVNPLAAGVCAAPCVSQVWPSGTAPGLSRGAWEGVSWAREELCCCPGGCRAPSVNREAEVTKSSRDFQLPDGHAGDELRHRHLARVRGVLRSCRWVSSGVIWSSLTCALPALGTAREPPRVKAFYAWRLKHKVPFRANPLQ